jgi:hypothetical protein
MAKRNKKNQLSSNSSKESSNINSSNYSTPIKINPNKKGKKAKKIPIKKGQWSLEEDKLLEQWVKQYGPKDWVGCGNFIQGRSGKQCREHWNNCLNPDLIKGDWTEEEDFLIMFFYEKCKGSWKKIVLLFNGRTENAIKNRFFSQLRKYATKNMNSKERRRLCAKIKLHELKNHINEALSEAKAELLKKSKMNEKQFNLFIKNNEQKIKENISEESEKLFDLNLSTNYTSSITEEETNKKFSGKKMIFEDDKSCENDYNFLLSENDEFTIDKSDNEKMIFEEQNNLNKNVFENVNDFSNDICHNNLYNIDEYNNSNESSLNKIPPNNSLKKLFKENYFLKELIFSSDDRYRFKSDFN